MPSFPTVLLFMGTALALNGTHLKASSANGYDKSPPSPVAGPPPVPTRETTIY